MSDECHRRFWLEETMTQPTSPVLPRWSLAIPSVLHGALYTWVAAVLPWSSWTFFAVASVILAGLHTAKGLLAAFRSRGLWWVWRAQAAASLIFMLLVGWGLLSSAWYLRGVYAGLGAGLAGALVGVFAWWWLSPCRWRGGAWPRRGGFGWVSHSASPGATWTSRLGP
ncbi:MAG TPA: hypothetical protein EYQ31_12605 [Candidatus Handelsmanbacteria bacterium]|nr:hypothetical protein [Candidatus Handelsmanbacteria bacterium]